MKTVIGQKSFAMADQIRFAEASGDWNPVHMDPLAARRTQMGAPIVHGVHTALSCLDFFARHDPKFPCVSTIAVVFPKPVFAGDEVRFVIVQRSESQLRLEAQVDEITVMTMDLTLDPVGTLTPAALAGAVKTDISRDEPADLSFEQIAELKGKPGRMEMTRGSAALFTEASRWLGEGRVAALAALSSIVGMKCPGLHSIFLNCTVDMTAADTSGGVAFSVARADDRMRWVTMHVEGGGLHGSVTALVRMPPVAQPALSEIAKHIPPKRFAGQHALIIGGSRGLGEYVAKAVIAGGGTVTLTYAVGIAEARALLDEIKAFGGRGEIMAYDARKPAQPQLAALKTVPTHVYYFATNMIFSIFSRRAAGFDAALYEAFYQFYVAGYYDLCSALHKQTPRFRVFYPSSVMIDERPRGMTEYAMAKAAGEVLCGDLNKLLPGVTAIFRRLPRLATDQTATTTPIAMANMRDEMLPILFSMQDTLPGKQ